MNKSLLFATVVLTALAVTFSCGRKQSSEPVPEPEPLPEAAPSPEDPSISSVEFTESGRIRMTAGDKAPAISVTLSTDEVEHKIPKTWRNYEIVVSGQKDKGQYEPDMKAIYDAVVDVFPLPMLVQWAWYGADAPGIWDREADIVYDQENFIISGEWKDPSGDFNDHFELKAWQVNAGTWTVGLNYQPLWDGDDGIGVYGFQMFWFYGPFGDATLYPLPEEDFSEPLPDSGDPHFDRYENTVSYPDAFNPAASRLYWNGWWFENR